MSRVIIEDTGRAWVVEYSGAAKWMGKVNGQVDLELVGPVDALYANGVQVYSGKTTGVYYDSVSNTTTAFPAYDSFEAFEVGFYWLCATVIFLYLLRFMARMLTNRNPTL